MLERGDLMTLSEFQAHINQLKREKIEKSYDWVGTVIQDGGTSVTTLKQDLHHTELNVSAENPYMMQAKTFPFFHVPSLSQSSIIYVEQNKLFGIISPV